MSSVTLAQASSIVDAALGKGRELKLLPLTVVVLDAGGHMVALKREDKSGIARVEIATGKAWGALGMGFGSRELFDRWQKAPMFVMGYAAASQGRMVGDYISTSYGSDNLAHGVFATASAPTTGSGTSCSTSALDNCNEPTDTFSTGLAATGSASSATGPILFGGNNGNSSSLWNVVNTNGRKHRD